MSIPTARYRFTADDDTKKAFKSFNSSVNKSKKNLKKLQIKTALGTLSLGYLGKEALMAADAHNELQQRIKSATKETGDYVEMSRELFAITQQNGVAFRTTVELFQRMAIASRDLGATNYEILELTTMVQQLGIIGGSTQSQMDSGLLQLSQGLGEGIFRAQEFNSVLENLPLVLTAIADGLGVTKSELRKMVIDGQLLSEDVFQVLVEQAGEVEEEFSEIPLTLKRSVTVFTNALGKSLSEIDQKIGATSFLSQLLIDASEAIAPTHDLTVELKLLTAQLNAGNFSGRSAKEQRGNLVRRIGELKEEILQASIEAGDIDAMQERLTQLNATISKVSASLAATPEKDRVKSKGRGRSKLVTEYGQESKQLEKLIAERKSLLTLMENTEVKSEETLTKIHEASDENVSVAEKAFKSTRTELEKYQKTVEALANAYADKAFNNLGGDETYYRALDEAAEDYQKTLEKINKEQAKVTSELKTRASDIFESTRTPLETYQREVEELANLYQSGAFDDFGGQDTYFRALEQARTEFEKFQEDNRAFAADFSQVWADTLNTFSQGVGDAVGEAILTQQSFGDVMREVTRGVIKEVISGLVQIGIKHLALAAISEKTKAASTSTGVAQAGALAAAYATPAALVSLASYGANAYPAQAGLATTVALSNSMALSGIAHDGLDFVPDTGTYLLKQGEMVLNEGNAKEMRGAIRDKKAEPQEIHHHYHTTYEIRAIDAKGVSEFLNQNAGTINQINQRAYERKGKREYGPL